MNTNYNKKQKEGRRLIPEANAEILQELCTEEVDKTKDMLINKTAEIGKTTIDKINHLAQVVLEGAPFSRENILSKRDFFINCAFNDIPMQTIQLYNAQMTSLSTKLMLIVFSTTIEELTEINKSNVEFAKNIAVEFAQDLANTILAEARKSFGL